MKHLIQVGAGVVDSDYRGEITVLLYNHGRADYQVTAGDRVAQLILEKIHMLNVQEVETLPESVRGAGGFGSTGMATEEDGKDPKRMRMIAGADKENVSDGELKDVVGSLMTQVEELTARLAALEGRS